MTSKDLISSLGKSKASEILLALLEQKSMSFTELMKITEGNPRTLSDRIKELSEYNIISAQKDTAFPFKETIKLTEEGIELAKRIKIAYANSEGVISKRAEILLYMIGELGNEIKGTTKMEKLPFLLEKEFGVTLAYHYIPMEYGPYSIELLDEINLLQLKDYITIKEELVPVTENNETKEVERRVYCLTEKGKEKSQKISQQISEEIKISIQNIKRYNDMTLRELLNYVHTSYPEYKKNNKNCG